MQVFSIRRSGRGTRDNKQYLNVKVLQKERYHRLRHLSAGVWRIIICLLFVLGLETLFLHSHRCRILMGEESVQFMTYDSICCLALTKYLFLYIIPNMKRCQVIYKYYKLFR